MERMLLKDKIDQFYVLGIPVFRSHKQCAISFISHYICISYGASEGV